MNPHSPAAKVSENLRYPLHPICETFSDYRGTEQFSQLVESMRQFGYDMAHPISIFRDADGEKWTIDGRHRISGADEAGIVLGSRHFVEIEHLRGASDWQLTDYLYRLNVPARRWGSARRVWYFLEYMWPMLQQQARDADVRLNADGSVVATGLSKVTLAQAFPHIPTRVRGWRNVMAHYASIGTGAGSSGARVSPERLFKKWREGHREWLKRAAEENEHLATAYRRAFPEEFTVNAPAKIARVRRHLTDQQKAIVALIGIAGGDETPEGVLSGVWRVFKSAEAATPQQFVEAAKKAVKDDL